MIVIKIAIRYLPHINTRRCGSRDISDHEAGQVTLGSNASTLGTLRYFALGAEHAPLPMPAAK
jgi:hypothetical protein